MRWILLCCALAGHAAAAKAPLRICVDDQPHPPYVYPDHDGSLQQLVRAAAAQAGRTVHFLPAPILRCRELARTGGIDGQLAMAYISANLALYAFPYRRGAIDTERAVVSTRTMAFRLKGSTVQWDGKRFDGLATPVLIPRGVLLLEERLGAMGQPFDAGARASDANFDKLLAGRGALAIGYEHDGQALLKSARYAGKIDMLALPFTEEFSFLVFSQPYYRANTDEAERLWTAIGVLKKKSP
ncbi:MAG: hypothetical protein V4463_12005 [Pseudomonadota bacterium]